MRRDETSLRLDPPPWLLDRGQDAAEADDRRPADEPLDDAVERQVGAPAADDHALHGWV